MVLWSGGNLQEEKIGAGGGRDELFRARKIFACPRYSVGVFFG